MSTIRHSIGGGGWRSWRSGRLEVARAKSGCAVQYWHSVTPSWRSALASPQHGSQKPRRQVSHQIVVSRPHPRHGSKVPAGRWIMCVTSVKAARCNGSRRRSVALTARRAGRPSGHRKYSATFVAPFWASADIQRGSSGGISRVNTRGGVPRAKVGVGGACGPMTPTALRVGGGRPGAHPMTVTPVCTCCRGRV